MSVLADCDHNDVISLSVKVCERSTQNSQTRAYKLIVTTDHSERIPLIIWEQSPAADLNWTVGKWYHIEDVLVKQWSETTELNAANQTTAERINHNATEEQHKTEGGSDARDKHKLTAANLAKLDVAANETPDSQPVVETFEHLREELTTTLSGAEWSQRYVWEANFTTPYIGPDNPTESPYVWLGFVDEWYEPLPRASNALQLEFGIDTDSTTGFLGQDVIWGILLGPWANDDVVTTLKDNLRTHSHVFAQFLADNDEYVLLTTLEKRDTPTQEEIKASAAEIEKGFAITRDLELSELPDIDVFQTTAQTMADLTPLYRLLAGITDAPPVRLPSELTESAGARSQPAPAGWDIDSLASATELDTYQIESTVDYLLSQDCSQDAAIGYVRRYLKEMLAGDGLFAVSGVGPSSGRALVAAGITTIEELQTATPADVSERTTLSTQRLQRLKEAARTGGFSSLDPDDNEVAKRLLASKAPPDSIAVSDSSDAANGQRTDSETVNGSQETEERSEGGTNSTETTPRTSSGEHEIQRPDELPLPDHDNSTMVGNTAVLPNYLTEYYEAFRNARKVLELVFLLEGVDIDPDDRTDPRVQYYILLDACIGFTDLSISFTGYGPQHQDRLSFSVKDYYEAFGDGRTITEYQVVNITPFTEDTHSLLQRTGHIASSTEFVRPCAPGTEIPLPELPGSFAELQEAMKLLGTFPAYPPLPTENGINDRTIPIADVYRSCFSDLNSDHRVDLGPLASTEDSPPTGPVPDATPTSTAEAESKLLDYGRLSHLFRRLTPPADSPVARILPVFALDWYRSTSPSFNALKALAKHGEENPIDIFQPRLRDLVHRRFLLDEWKYDYITVFPSHEAGSLSPQLVELAQAAVLETEVLYTPLLERTETVKRQREKSEVERQEVAIEPSASLRARAKLTGETVILFDDICTTGSSLLAGAQLLRQAGAGRVVGLTLGLTPGGPQKNVVEITDPDAIASAIIAGVDR